MNVTNPSVDAAAFHPGLFEWPVPVGSTPRLVASRCPSCGFHAFPAKQFCPRCQAGGQEAAFLSGRGRIYAFTTVDLPPKIMGGPYIVAYVDMEERVRIFAQIVDAHATELRVNDPVRVDFRILRANADGHSVVGYAFVRAGEHTI